MTHDNATSDVDRLNGIVYRGLFYYNFGDPSRTFDSATRTWTEWQQEYTLPQNYYRSGKLYIEEKKGGDWVIDHSDLDRRHKNLSCNEIPAG
ncbi:hypothetical protein SBDP1_370034 [Syntrophobacter sp. SbD1]|nr:hypothetical protein SBDP1_370034 [Syntrophobacter sp. SbD1]